MYLAFGKVKQGKMRARKPLISVVITVLLILKVVYVNMLRHGGLVVTALDFRSGGRWFEPSLCRRVVSSDKKLHSTLSLFTQVF